MLIAQFNIMKVNKVCPSHVCIGTSQETAALCSSNYDFWLFQLFLQLFNAVFLNNAIIFLSPNFETGETPRFLLDKIVI